MGLCIQPESNRKHVHMCVDSREVDQFQAPCFIRDTVTKKPLRGGCGRAPQCAHAGKSKFSLEKGHEVTWKGN